MATRISYLKEWKVKMQELSSRMDCESWRLNVSAEDETLLKMAVKEGLFTLNCSIGDIINNKEVK